MNGDNRFLDIEPKLRTLSSETFLSNHYYLPVLAAKTTRVSHLALNFTFLSAINELNLLLLNSSINVIYT